MKKVIIMVILFLGILITPVFSQDENIALDKTSIRLFSEGNVYYSKMKFKEAIVSYDKAIKRNLNFYQAYTNRGLAKIGLAAFENTELNLNSAINDFSKSIEINPKFEDAYFQRANAREVFDTTEAIKDYSKVIDLNPKAYDSYNNRGILKEGLSNYKEAINDYNKAIELNPRYAEAYNNRGSSNAKLTMHKEAINDYNKAIELNPRYAEAYNNRGFVKELLKIPYCEDFKVACDLGCSIGCYNIKLSCK